MALARSLALLVRVLVRLHRVGITALHRCETYEHGAEQTSASVHLPDDERERVLEEDGQRGPRPNRI